MSLSGSLEDVSVADVLQFVHLGGRSGTLSLVSGDHRAEIGFHRGRIISARGPSPRRLGDLLVQTGAISANQLDAALRQQKRMQPAPPVGLLLVQMGELSQERLREVVERHVEQAIYEVVTWSTGTFEFIIDDLKPADDLSVAPGDILPDIHLNTQMVLLEAARIFDEKNSKGRRAGAAGLGAAPPSTSLASDTSVEPAAGAQAASGVSPVGAGAASQARTGDAPDAMVEPAPPLRLQILSEDRVLSEALERILSCQKALVVRVTARDAGNPLPGEPAPVVLVDLALGQPARDLLISLRRTRPHAMAIALADGAAATGAFHAGAYQAGAVAVVPRDVPAVVACFQTVVRHRRDGYSDKAVRDGLRAGFAKLRRLLGEFRSGLVSATVSLNLMNIISESVDRAVLFVVRRSDLMAMGAFGHTADGRGLAERCQGLRLELDEAGPLAESVRDGRSRTLRFDGAGLPEGLAALVGPPASGECTIFPVLGGKRVIATVYADNGRRNRPLDDLEFLELATSQVGMAYENEFLRRHVAQPAADTGPQPSPRAAERAKAPQEAAPPTTE